jgi:Na+/phosphate symporter
LKKIKKFFVRVEEQLKINEEDKKNHELLIEFLRKEFIKHVGDVLEEKEEIAKSEASLKLEMQDFIQGKDEKLLDLKSLNITMLKVVEDKENEKKMAKDEERRKLNVCKSNLMQSWKIKTMNSKFLE